ncbi:MAG TPA: hypothetical protein VF337_11440, partial [Candidatus Limnocylindrales bacterium]
MAGVERRTSEELDAELDPQPHVDVAARKRGRSPVTAAILSFLFPGLGHLALGRRRTALLFFVPSFLAVSVVVVLLATQGWTWFGLSLFDESFAAALVAVTLLLGLWRVAAVANSFLIAGGSPRRRRWEMAVLTALVVCIVAGHGATAYGAWSVYHAGDAMNHNLDLSDAALAADANSTASPEITPYQTQTALATASPTPSPTPTAAPTYPVNNDRITFALLGVDFMTGRSHGSTDTMMLATLDVHTNKATVISIPRDTAGFELYYGGRVASTFRLNYLMSAAAS